MEPVESTHQLYAFLDSLPGGLLVLDRRRCVTFANRALRARLGLPPIAGLINVTLEAALLLLGHYHRCDGPAPCLPCVAERVAELALARHASVEDECLQESGASQLGAAPRVWRVRGVPRDETGDQLIVLALDDVTDEGRRRVLERLFLHDLLNTATTLWGTVQLLRDDAALLADLVPSLVFLCGRLIGELTEQQSLSAAEADEIRVRAAPLRSRELLHEVVEEHRSYEQVRGVALAIDPRAAEVDFASDPVLLKRVLGNLVKNAAEATAPGQTITLGCSADDSELEFSVSNPAVIAQQSRPFVFEDTAAGRRHFRGLGTYSSRLLSERYLSGRVRFTSEHGQGTTFFARYPRALQVVNDR